MGKAIRSATKDSLISTYSENKSGQSFGFHKMMDVAGEMSGALIAFGILYWLGKSETVFRELFAWTLLPSVIAVLIVIFFVQDTPYCAKEHRQSLDLRKDKALFPTLLLYFAFIFFLFSDSFFIVKAKEAGIEIEFIPLLMVLYNFIQTSLSYFIGVQIDRYSPRLVLGLSMGFGIAAMGALYLDMVIVGFVFLAIFTVASLNAVRALISNEAINKGTIYGILYGGVALFSALGATIIGIIWKQFNQEIAILFSLGGLSLIGLLNLLLGYMKKP